MTNISVVDPGVSPSHCDIIFFLLKEIFPNGVAILFSINLMMWKNFTKVEENYK